MSNIHKYNGFVYAFYGSGGFTIDQSLNVLKLVPESEIYQYDVTEAIQVEFDVRTFNEKIGVYKDPSNESILFTSYDYDRDYYTKANPINGIPVCEATILDSITINAEEFVYGLDTKYVLSVGTYSTMYLDFMHYVNTYFGYAEGFGNIFSGVSEYDLNNGIFDASAFINIINPYYVKDESGNNLLIKPLHGSISITNLNTLLKYAINTNCFENRNYADLSRNIFGCGFMDGDLILIPAGTTVHLNLVFDTSLFQPVVNYGPQNVGFNADGTIVVNGLTYNTNKDTAIVTNNPYYNELISGKFSTRTVATDLNIKRTLTAPLLIRLTNMSRVSGVGGYYNGYSAPRNPAGLIRDLIA